MKLPDLEEQVLGSARRAMRPSPSDARRVRAAVLAQIGAATIGHAAGAKAAGAKAAGAKAAGAKAAGGWFASLGPIQTALVVAAATGGVGAVANLYWSSHDARTSAAPSAATVHTAVAPTRRPPEPLPALDQARPGASNSSPRPGLKGNSTAAPPRGPAGVQRDRLAEEVRLLRRADRALRNGAPDVAERLLRDLAASHPDGQLREERAATRALILCQREDGTAARSAAEKFLAAHPASMYAARIRAACMEGRVESEGTPDARTHTPVKGTQ
jgi:hypothetical protein